MERKIGEIFEYNGEWYQCIKDTEYTRCINCCFYNGGHKLCTDEDMGACVKEYRSDAKSICFKKLQKIGEPYDDCGTILQRFKIYINVTNADTKGLELHIYSNDTIGIEIKQNKECMEENKLNLKPFDIQKAKAGKPVCTRDGRKARIICFDVKAKKPIAALITNDDTEEAHFYYDNGRSDQYQEYRYDLMMLPEKKEGWVNVYKRENEYVCENECNVSTGIAVYKSEGEAKRNIDKNEIYVNTIKISWEE